MTRVLHVSWEYPPLVYGGLGRYLDALTRAQVVAGHQVTVLTSAVHALGQPAPALPQRERLGGVDVLRARPPGERRWSDLVGACAVLADSLAGVGCRALQAGEVDVVHSHDWMVAPAGRLLAARLGVPWVHSVHATEFGRRAGRLDSPVPRAVHAAEVASVAGPDAVVVCADRMRSEVVDVLGASAGRVHVVPSGVDARAWAVETVDRDRARRRWAPDGPLVVCAGRLEWEKGLSTVVRAAPAVAAGRPGVRVVMAGEGSYRPVLEALVRDLAAPVDLPGWLRLDDLRALLAAADVVVVPSRYEPFGLVAREAQAAGTCVAVTTTGGLADAVVDGRTGRHFAVGDVDHLASILVDLLADDAMRARLAAAGRQHAATRTWGRTAAGVAGVYRVLARPQRYGPGP